MSKLDSFLKECENKTKLLCSEYEVEKMSGYVVVAMRVNFKDGGISNVSKKVECEDFRNNREL